MTSQRTGLVAMLDEAGAGDDVLPTVAEQLGLLGMAAPEAVVARTGRPAGRRNLRNQRIAAYLIERHGDPLEELHRMAMLPVDAIREALAITKAEAFAEKRLCLAALLPYIHQRQAITVDVTQRSIVHLSIVDEGADEADGVDMVLDGLVLDVKQNQQVSEVTDAPV